MTAPSEKLARSLNALHLLQERGVIAIRSRTGIGRIFSRMQVPAGAARLEQNGVSGISGTVQFDRCDLRRSLLTMLSCMTTYEHES